MVTRNSSLIVTILTLLGAFAFAFVTNEAIHEVGHYLMHRVYGGDVGIRLDPFGSSRILGGAASSAPMGPTSLAGPAFSLLVSTTVFAVLWRWRRPLLLPLLLMLPVAMTQEGVTFSFGLLTPGGDASFIVTWGLPAPVLLTIGALLLVCGIALLTLLLPLAGLPRDARFGRRWLVLVVSMVAFMLLRLIVSAILRSGDLMEGIVPLVFALLLSLAGAGAFVPMQRWLGDGVNLVRPIAAGTVVVCLGSAVGMIALQLAILN